VLHPTSYTVAQFSQPHCGGSGSGMVVSVTVAVAVPLAVPLVSWGTTAATRVPRLRIGRGTPSRIDKRVAPDKEGAADKQCLGRRKTLIPNRGRWSPLSLFRQVHLGEGKSEYNPPFSGLRAASTWEAVSFCGSHRQTCSDKVVIVVRRMIPLLRGKRQAHSPSAGTAESQMPTVLSWG